MSEALRVPPAWTQVAVSPTANASVQAVGKDAAGRWQYLYHEHQTVRRERKKLDRFLRFLTALPRTRRAVARHLARQGIPREKVLAGILRILATCFLRPGSEIYASRNGSFGVATLRRRHVSVRGDRIRFDFKGKSGRQKLRELRDRRLARLLRDLLRYQGEVFKYRAEDGGLTDVRSNHINVYVKEVMGERFSAKDFRTWAGTLLCACALARGESRERLSAVARKKRIVAAIREAAEHLGNTPAVCRSSYVFPAVLRRYEQGRVIRDHFQDVGELVDGDFRKIERTERALLELLRASRRGSPEARQAPRARPAQRRGRRSEAAGSFRRAQSRRTALSR